MTNRLDAGAATHGTLPPERVRSVAIDEFLVDTGATTLCLPLNLITRLGLPLKKEVVVRTAGGTSVVGVFQDATVSIAGRSATVECLGLPEGTTPLLGCVPLELMGLEPDLVNRTLRILPDDTRDSYWLAY